MSPAPIESRSAAVPRRFAHARWVLVLLVALLACGGCLLADFYMDDLGFVTDSTGSGPPKFRVTLFGQIYGNTDPDALGVHLMNLIPSAIFALTGVLAPANPAVSHLWNLGFHLALCLAIFRLGPGLLEALHLFREEKSRQRASLLGALLFACHPLGSEAVFYAKCINTQVVALTVFWATVRIAQFLRTPGQASGRAVILPVVLTVLSYFPGTVQLAASAAVLLLATGPRRVVAMVTSLLPAGWWRSGRGKAVAVSAVLAGLFVAQFFARRAIVNLGEANFAEHVVTQGRVFWEYARRMVVPTGLCSDHFFPWSEGLSDTGGVLLLAGWGLLTALLAGIVARRPAGAAKGIAVLALLMLLPFLIRLLYVNSEIMVEYRAYPALPWLGLIAGCGLAALWERRAVPALGLAALLVAGGVVLCEERGVVWQSARSLAEDVIAQYPLNNRARTQLESLDYDAGEYAAVLRRHEEVLAVRQEIVSRNEQTAGRTRIDTNRTEAATVNSFQWAIYARAELEGAVKTLVWADHVVDSLRTAMPGRFVEATPGATVGAWPVVFARDAVAKAAAVEAAAGQAP